MCIHAESGCPPKGVRGSVSFVHDLHAQQSPQDQRTTRPDTFVRLRRRSRDPATQETLNQAVKQSSSRLCVFFFQVPPSPLLVRQRNGPKPYTRVREREGVLRRIGISLFCHLVSNSLNYRTRYVLLVLSAAARTDTFFFRLLGRISLAKISRQDTRR